jgi:hypothetical protein
MCSALHKVAAEGTTMQATTIQPGDTYEADLTVSGWTVPGSVIILDVQQAHGRTQALMLVAQGTNPDSSGRWQYARGTATGELINHIASSNGLTAVQLTRHIEQRDADAIAYNAGEAKRQLDLAHGPADDDAPVGQEGMPYLDRLGRRAADARETIEEIEEERDEMVRRMLAGGVAAQTLADRLGLSRSRIYQIRDDRR